MHLSFHLDVVSFCLLLLYLFIYFISSNLKVQENDRLSPKICHACISYLNSWQSFKNRCDAAQRKQKSWSGLTTGTSDKALIPGTSLLKVTASSGNQLKPAIENAQQKFQQAELQKEKLQQLAKQQHLQDLKMKHLQLQLLNDQKSAGIDVVSQNHYYYYYNQPLL